MNHKRSLFRTPPTAAELYTPPAFADQAAQMLARSQARFGADRFRMEDPPEGDDTDKDKGDDGADADKDKGDDGADDPTAKLDLSKLPTEVQDLVKKYRKEAAEANGKAREEARQKAAEAAVADVTKKIAEALGLTKAETDKLTPEQLQQKLEESTSTATKAQEAAKQTQIELAVYRTASKKDIGGDPEALLDSRSFLAKVQALDPAAKDFNVTVTAAIKDAIKDNPKLKLQAGAGSSSADHGGAGGDTGSRTAKSLTDAVGGHYGV
jgi:hypothetical protein